ncbi:LysR family transcriptional regulator [Paracoccus pantotrophus]|uniref:LysR family transcriptional regulator n=1 Tax=Paracoccus pantotrophus TaxID=82367 RepID=A0A7H9BZ05_PARPN|nr:LysR family transcriptional regulator [Paracoccus pantotrophus]QLH16048.1 LysR family transcriptional regulator [Paracoccus pantotrophus]
MIDETMLRLLPSLVAIIEESSVSGAARRMAVSQPRMSARLAELRALFGDPLLVPSGKGRGLIPTDHGTRIAGYASQFLADLESRLADETFDSKTATRTFHIMANDNATTIIGVPLIEAIQRAEAARMRIAFHQFDPHKLEDLETGKLDLAVGAPSQFAKHGTLMSRKVVRDRLVTIGKAASQHEAMDLDRFCSSAHVIVSGDGGGFEGIVDKELSKIGRTRHVAVSVQSYLAAIETVRKTELLATMPHSLTSRRSADLAIFEPPIALPEISLSVAWHPRANDAGNRWLRELLWAITRQA